MKFECDKNKEQINISKHRLSFDVAEDIFAGNTFTFSDKRQDYNEPRFITIGELKSRMVVVAHTYILVPLRFCAFNSPYYGDLKTHR